MEVTRNKKKIPQRKKASPTLTTIVDEIRQEYGLKRNHFNPKGPSPNLFVSKLQMRMKKYYKDLYNSANRDTK